MGKKRPTIDELIDVILKHEGGYVNDPADKGGATNMGITIHTLSDYLGRKATVQEVKDMTKVTAREIYRNQYLLKPKIDSLPDPVRIKVFDWGVNSGPSRAVKKLQKVASKFGKGTLVYDGDIGRKTLALVNAINLVDLNNALVDERNKFYHGIVRRNPTQKKFLKGWLRRSESFRLDK